MGKIYDVRAVTGEYKQDGEDKKRYQTIGAVLETKNGGQALKLDMIPTNWDGFAYLNEPRENTTPRRIDTVPTDIDTVNGVVDLSEIPF